MHSVAHTRTPAHEFAFEPLRWPPGPSHRAACCSVMGCGRAAQRCRCRHRHAAAGAFGGCRTGERCAVGWRGFGAGGGTDSAQHIHNACLSVKLLCARAPPFPICRSASSARPFRPCVACLPAPPPNPFLHRPTLFQVESPTHTALAPRLAFSPASRAGLAAPCGPCCRWTTPCRRPPAAHRWRRRRGRRTAASNPHTEAEEGGGRVERAPPPFKGGPPRSCCAAARRWRSRTTWRSPSSHRWTRPCSRPTRSASRKSTACAGRRCSQISAPTSSPSPTSCRQGRGLKGGVKRTHVRTHPAPLDSGGAATAVHALVMEWLQRRGSCCPGHGRHRCALARRVGACAPPTPTIARDGMTSLWCPHTICCFAGDRGQPCCRHVGPHRRGLCQRAQLEGRALRDDAAADSHARVPKVVSAASPPLGRHRSAATSLCSNWLKGPNQ